MSPCPCCGGSTTPHTTPRCTGCQDHICPNCYYGARYCCSMVRLAAPAPPVTRQLTENKWELAEDIMRDNPEIKECIVYRIPNRHIYKLVRDGMRTIRVHITLSG